MELLSSANPKFHLLLVRAVTGTARRREAAAEKTPTASFPPFLLLLTVCQRPKGLLRADAKGKGGTPTTATQVKVIRKEKHGWVPASPRQDKEELLACFPTTTALFSPLGQRDVRSGNAEKSHAQPLGHLPEACRTAGVALQDCKRPCP